MYYNIKVCRLFISWLCLKHVFIINSSIFISNSKCGSLYKRMNNVMLNGVKIIKEKKRAWVSKY